MSLSQTLRQPLAGLRERIGGLWGRAGGERLPIRDWIGGVSTKPVQVSGYDTGLIWVTGLLLAWLNDYIGDALLLRRGHIAIGTGMWLALIMAFNVWFIIWPNQKKALGLVEASADAKAKAGRLAMLTSRINTLLSIPMLYCMAAQSHGGLNGM